MVLNLSRCSEFVYYSLKSLQLTRLTDIILDERHMLPLLLFHLPTREVLCRSAVVQETRKDESTISIKPAADEMLPGCCSLAKAHTLVSKVLLTV